MFGHLFLAEKCTGEEVVKRVNKQQEKLIQLFRY
jgi:hypothetical protein